MKILLKSISSAVFFICLFVANAHAEKVKDMPLVGLAETQDSSFGQLKGQWLYVDFWASWCLPCKKSFPFMVQLQDKFKDKNFKVVAISVDSKEAAAINFLKYNPTNFLLFHDPKGKLAEQFQLPSMPSSYLINPQGEIVSKHVGFFESSAAKIEKEISAALK